MVYQDKKQMLEDNRSTAYTFLFIGGIGLVCMLLFAADVIHFPMSGYMKTLMLVVMTALFLMFFVIGIVHFRKLGQIADDADTETTLTGEIRTWFLDSFSAAQIEESLDITEGDSIEQLYFVRYEHMRLLLRTKYPELKEDYEEHILEELYNEIFSQA